MKNEIKELETGSISTPRSTPRLKTLVTGENQFEATVAGDLSRIDLATGGGDLTDGLLRQLTNLGSTSASTDDDATNFALGFVDAMQPEDAAEALLCAQMAAVHQATMMMARRLNRANHPEQAEAAERAFNKLGRTFAAQMDTLKRYRSKAQQVVRVERVTVQQGGQAIVGNVEHRGEG